MSSFPPFPKYFARWKATVRIGYCSHGVLQDNLCDHQGGTTSGSDWCWECRMVRTIIASSLDRTVLRLQIFKLHVKTFASLFAAVQVATFVAVRKNDEFYRCRASVS